MDHFVIKRLHLDMQQEIQAKGNKKFEGKQRI